MPEPQAPQPGAPNAPIRKGRGHVEKHRAEVEARREKVLQLRLMKKTTRQIAEILGVERTTISRDLTHMQAAFRVQYGVENFDPAVAVAEAIETFNFCEARAITEFLSLDRAQESGAEHIRKAIAVAMPQLLAEARVGIGSAIKDRLDALAEQVSNIARADKSRTRALTYAKLRCLQQARGAVQARMDLLQDVGLVDRQVGSAGEVRGDARRIKAWLDTVQVMDAELVSSAEQKYLTGDTETTAAALDSVVKDRPFEPS
jgi:hypothetical protein